MSAILDKNFKPMSRDIRYLGKDFSQLKSNLIDFAKQYYPKTYKDFNDASPGTMFIDMAAYVGDLLSFYIDYQFKEGLIDFAEERKNVIQLVSYLGYSPRPSRPSITVLDLYQIVPAKSSPDGSFYPDPRYVLRIKEGFEALSSNRTSFITSDSVDFSRQNSSSPRVDEVFSRNSSGEPEFYLLKKSCKAYSGKTLTQKFNVVGQNPNLKIELSENNVIKIVSVTDSDNNNWYHVDYLAQDLIELPVENNDLNFETLSAHRSTVPNILKFLRTNRRFILKIDVNNKTSLQFGPSVDNVEEEILIPNSSLLGLGFSNINKFNLTLDPTSFTKSNAYGLSPYNTELTIKYIVGGGIESNANSDDINTIGKVEIEELHEYLPSEINLVNTIKNSIRVNNPVAATGGSGEESISEMKQNAISNFAAQDRIVTSDDYIARVLNMPSEFGSVSKVYVTTESDISTNNTSFVTGLIDYNDNIIVDSTNKDFRKINLEGVNQFGINLHILTYDENKNLTRPNEALIYNLRNYLSKYRIISDRVNILDGYVINIGVDFSILTYSNYNKKEVLSQCVEAVKNFFDIDMWQFSQPINISQLELEISKVEGVQSVSNIMINNIFGNGYSVIEYNIEAATKNKIIYPSIDPSIFEIKNPKTDIRGKTL